jgi:galactoside O-acetyltransferase
VYTSLIGKGKITIEDYANISSRVSIYSSNDDYSGDYMTNPTVNSKYTNVTSAPVCVGRHVIVGSGSIILPGVILDEGVCIGALSIVNKSCEPFSIYGGIPIKFIRERSRGLKEKYIRMMQDESKS